MDPSASLRAGSRGRLVYRHNSARRLSGPLGLKRLSAALVLDGPKMKPISDLGFIRDLIDWQRSLKTTACRKLSDMKRVGEELSVNRDPTRTRFLARPAGRARGRGFLSDSGDSRPEPECFAGGTRSCGLAGRS